MLPLLRHARYVLSENPVTGLAFGLFAMFLLAAILGFLPADDDRLRSSVLAIADNLSEQGFVLRYAPRRPTTVCRARRGRS